MKKRERKGTKPEGKKIGGLMMICLLIGCIAVLSVGAVTLAKYLMNWDSRNVAVPVNFCFESDYLKEGASVPEYTIYTGAVTFQLKNNDGINVTTEPISYTVGITPGTGGTLSKSSGTIAAGGAVGGQHADAITLTGAADTTYTVTATSTSPYAKTLSAKFTFDDAQGKTVYSVTDSGYYDVLDIYTGNTGGNLTISYGSDLAPDNTNSLMTEWISGTSRTLPVSPYAHYTLVFFENTAGDYAKAQTLLESGTTTISLSLEP